MHTRYTQDSTPYHNTFLTLTLFFPDLDECTSGTAQCGPGAECINLNGTFACQCRVGFEKIGNSCIGELNLLCNCTLTNYCNFTFLLSNT